MCALAVCVCVLRIVTVIYRITIVFGIVRRRVPIRQRRDETGVEVRGREGVWVFGLVDDGISTYEPDERDAVLPRRIFREQFARRGRRDDRYARNGREGVRRRRSED